MTRKILSAVFAAALAVGMLGCTAITAEAPTASEEAAATATPTAAEEIAATETPVAATTYKTAFITRKLFSEQQAYAWKQFQQYCGDYGFTMDVFEGQNDVQNEEKAVSICIAQDYDVIFINPSDTEAIVPSLMAAKEAGVIIGMFASDLATEYQQYRDFFCGVDDTMAGQAAGQAFLDHFPDGGAIVEIGGPEGDDTQIKRHDGFVEKIEGSNITLLDSRNCSGWVTSDAADIMEDLIDRYGDQIQGVFCHWDNGATGVIEALMEANMTGVYVVAADGCRAGYDQVKAGTQAVCIGENFTNMAIQSLMCAQAALEGQPFDAVNFIPFDVVTADNIGTFPYPEW